MGRLRDFGWWLREHAGVIALVLALVGCGAGAAGIVIALDAKDKAEDAAAVAASSSTVAPPPLDAEVQAQLDEFNERVKGLEESVAQMRTETTGETSTTPEETTPPTDETTPPELPEGIELPEGVEIPGAGAPESEAPKP
jgi:hypothetical protein